MTHHSNKQPGLLRSASNAGVTYNTNRKARSKTSQPDRKTGAELDKASVERHLGGNFNGLRLALRINRDAAEKYVRFPEIRTETTRP